MLNSILNLKNGKNSIHEFADSIRQGIPSAAFGVTDAFRCLLACSIDSPVLYVVKDYLTARFVTSEIKELSGKNVVYLPAKDEVLLPTRASSKDQAYERISAISDLNSADIIVATVEAVMQTLPKKIEKVVVKTGDTLDKMRFTEKLSLFGYTRVDSVESKGTYSVRGDVVDVYPINTETPVRIDFFDDSIDGIKQFDPETRKGMGFINEVTVLQASEYSFSKNDYELIKSLLKNEVAKAKLDAKVNLRRIEDDFLLAIENGDNETLSPLFALSSNSADITAYLTKETVVIYDEPKRTYEHAELVEKEFTERFKSLLKDGGVFSFTEKNFISLENLKTKLGVYRNGALSTLSTAIGFFNPLKIVNPNVSGVAKYQLDFNEFYTDVKNWSATGYSVLVCAGSENRADRLVIDLTDQGVMALSSQEIRLSIASVCHQELTSGFIFHEEKLAVIGSGNLFSRVVKERKIKVKKQNFFTAPEVGDYCVHEVHGIGRVLGNKRISSTEGTKDYVSVEYDGGDILYVPVEQMDILTRYLGGDKKPRLSKIGGADFERVKKAVKESIKKMSFDLQKLYAERKEQKGYKFIVENDLEEAFLQAFPFEDTPDQVIAEKEISEDMQSGKIMDRLVCGDVGFGKTEVAFRAVFRAVVNGKQSAMLAPTTILTEQHYNTAVERFKNFGVNIAVLNRFKTTKQQKQILEDLKEGKIDFIIGTHRLLSKDVKFKDLGLLVLDEEQRFGVEHKEKIKTLKSNVDTITLTATPIPRTLHMSLSGIREISVLNTPPKKRLPVQTYVTEESETLIKDAIMREVNRGGQAFILYNRVESIFSFAERVHDLLPSVKMTVVHGQMDEKVMEKNIISFYNGETDLLISTTIIENGIDLPRANTLIVIDADRLGLSTLYQLKGRVGRSDRLAYAYFTFKREKILSTTAFERLNAIIEFTEMGSGIKIAMRDLEIRGAGNVLGAEQHGHMDRIGYELYSKLLREELTGKEEKPPEMDVRLSAYIPETYIESNTMRMDAYKEIAEIDGTASAKEFISQAEDIYGKLPQETVNLINIALVKYLATGIGAKEVKVSREESSISFEDFNAFSDGKLISAVEKSNGQASISMTSVPKIVFLRNDGDTNEQMLIRIKDFFTERL